MVRVLPPEDYQACLEARFERVATRLRALVPHQQLEHVGSSSVPGAHSKGDLDVCLVVEPDRLEEVVTALLGAGYFEKFDTLRTEQLCMLLSPEGSDEHAVQVVATGSPFTNFIVFRDMLRSNPRLLVAYSQLKQKAASLGEHEYRRRKSVFIESALASGAGDVA